MTLAKTLKSVPPPEELIFGQVRRMHSLENELHELMAAQTMTDHMVSVTYHPVTGWSNPEIKPYSNISLDPACSIFQYSTSVFEGMKVRLSHAWRYLVSHANHLFHLQAYVGPDGKPRLFRPAMNMQRMKRSVTRIALPVCCVFSKSVMSHANMLDTLHRPSTPTSFSNSSRNWLPSSHGGYPT